MSRAIFVSGVLRIAGQAGLRGVKKRKDGWVPGLWIRNGCHEQLREQRLATHR
jgi:hypothetical protein